MAWKVVAVVAVVVVVAEGAVVTFLFAVTSAMMMVLGPEIPTLRVGAKCLILAISVFPSGLPQEPRFEIEVHREVWGVFLHLSLLYPPYLCCRCRQRLHMTDVPVRSLAGLLDTTAVIIPTGAESTGMVVMALLLSVGRTT